MSRYLERADNVARFIEVNQHLMIDQPGIDEERLWMPLVTTTGDQEDFDKLYDKATRTNVVEFLTFNLQYRNSILSCLHAARENARSIREIISSELWVRINNFYQSMREASKNPSRAQSSTADFYDHINWNNYVCSGAMDSTMTHGEAWQFAHLGRMLERADKTSRILDVKYYLLLPELDDVGTPLDNIQWAAVLKSVNALEMYRKKNHKLAPNSVAEFLIFDREFPRAMHYCLVRASQSLFKITGSPGDSYNNPAERKIGRITSDLGLMSIDDVFDQGLHEYLDTFQDRLNGLDRAIYDSFLAVPA
jgi:uncharacterized alpha-E superfamily protein